MLVCPRNWTNWKIWYLTTYVIVNLDIYSKCLIWDLRVKISIRYFAFFCKTHFDFPVIIDSLDVLNDRPPHCVMRYVMDESCSSLKKHSSSWSFILGAQLNLFLCCLRIKENLSPFWYIKFYRRCKKSLMSSKLLRASNETVSDSLGNSLHKMFWDGFTNKEHRALKHRVRITCTICCDLLTGNRLGWSTESIVVPI